MKITDMLDDKIIELRTYVNGNTSLDVKIKSNTYPMSIEFYDMQIDAFEDEVSEGVPTLAFVFCESMRIITAENFKIEEAVFNRLKNLSKEINRLYLHAFRQEIEKVISPLWDVADGSQVCIYRKDYFDKQHLNRVR